MPKVWKAKSDIYVQGVKLIESGKYYKFNPPLDTLFSKGYYKAFFEVVETNDKKILAQATELPVKTAGKTKK